VLFNPVTETSHLYSLNSRELENFIICSDHAQFLHTQNFHWSSIYTHIIRLKQSLPAPAEHYRVSSSCCGSKLDLY